MSKKPKIAVIGLKGLPAFGGAAAVGENIVEHLKDKYDFTIYSTKTHTRRGTGLLNGIYQIVFPGFPLKIFNTPVYYFLSVFHVIFFGKHDLVHLHHRDAAFLILLLRIRYKVVLTTHGGFGTRDKWKFFKKYFDVQEKYFVKYANAITCVSKNENRLYKRKYNIDTEYIPNGINKVDNILINKSPNRNGYIFFGAGRIIKTKGCEIMLKALNLINYSGKIISAGDLEQTPKYKQEILQLSTNLNTEFIGLIKNKSLLFKYLSNAKIFIFPSNREAMSMMLLEGASLKTPIIASDIIQNKDLFSDEEVLFFKTDDSKDLANKLLWALDNYDIMIQKSEKAYLSLIKNYLWSKIALKYDKVFQRIINK